MRAVDVGERGDARVLPYLVRHLTGIELGVHDALSHGALDFEGRTSGDRLAEIEQMGRDGTEGTADTPLAIRRVHTVHMAEREFMRPFRGGVDDTVGLHP